MGLGNYFLVPLFQDHVNNTVPETLVNVSSQGSMFIISPKLSCMLKYVLDTELQTG